MVKFLQAYSSSAARSAKESEQVFSAAILSLITLEFARNPETRNAVARKNRRIVKRFFMSSYSL
jgi:hypothetical protein